MISVFNFNYISCCWYMCNLTIFNIRIKFKSKFNKFYYITLLQLKWMAREREFHRHCITQCWHPLDIIEFLLNCCKKGNSPNSTLPYYFSFIVVHLRSFNGRIFTMLISQLGRLQFNTQRLKHCWWQTIILHVKFVNGSPRYGWLLEGVLCW